MTMFGVKKRLLCSLLRLGSKYWGAESLVMVHPPTDSYGCPHSEWQDMSKEEAFSMIENLDDDQTEYESAVTGLIEALTDLNFRAPLVKYNIGHNVRFAVIGIKSTEISKPVSEMTSMLTDIPMSIVDMCEPHKTESESQMWLEITMEEASEVIKEFSKMMRRIDSDSRHGGYLMPTPSGGEEIYGEMIKEILDLLVVGMTALVTTGRDYHIMEKYRLRDFIHDYVIYKTARAMGLCGRDVEISINSYRKD